MPPAGNPGQWGEGLPQVGFGRPRRTHGIRFTRDRDGHSRIEGPAPGSRDRDREAQGRFQVVLFEGSWLFRKPGLDYEYQFRRRGRVVFADHQLAAPRG